jgi:hypothetical protein
VPKALVGGLVTPSGNSLYFVSVRVAPFLSTTYTIVAAVNVAVIRWLIHPYVSVALPAEQLAAQASMVLFA